MDFGIIVLGFVFLVQWLKDFILCLTLSLIYFTINKKADFWRRYSAGLAVPLKEIMTAASTSVNRKYTFFHVGQVLATWYTGKYWPETNKNWARNKLEFLTATWKTNDTQIKPVMRFLSTVCFKPCRKKKTHYFFQMFFCKYKDSMNMWVINIYYRFIVTKLTCPSRSLSSFSSHGLWTAG